MENELYEFDSFGDVSVDQLMHWGIKGMKWGVRRYQNKDGSLTKAGRKRYAKLEAEMEKLGGKKAEDDAQNKPKKPKDMSDDELRGAINRMRMEDEYNRLYNQLHPQKVKNGKKYTETLLSAGVSGLAEGGKSLIRDALIKKGKEALGIKDEKPKSAYEKLKEQVDMEKLKKEYDRLKKGDSDYDKLKKKYDHAKLQKDYDNLDLIDELNTVENQRKIRVAQEWLNKPEHKKPLDD